MCHGNIVCFTFYLLTNVNKLSHLLSSSVSSSLQITNLSFQYASPHPWNRLPSSFRQPHSVHCPPGLPHPAHITSSQSPPSLASSVTPLAFHSRLKTPSLSQILSSIVSCLSRQPFVERDSDWRQLFQY